MSNRFTSPEKRAITGLTGIFALRMFGLFLLLPILAVYADSLNHSTPVLIGFALGVYGLTQALLQIPFGLLADRISRKKAIALGLCIFAIGSVICGVSESIFGLIAGRALQGAGAISSVILALTFDLIRVDQRTKAMALIGVSIGASFMLSLILAPVLVQQFGVNGIFYGITGLIVFAIWMLFSWIPAEQNRASPNSTNKRLHQVVEAFSNHKLYQPAVGILISHMILTSLFLIIPGIFIGLGHYPLSEHWKLYVPVLVLSAIGMAPLIKLASNQRYVSLVLTCCISLILLSLCLIAYTYQSSFTLVLIGLVIFFSAFNTLEAMLPSLASQQAPATKRATTMSAYSTFQFLGVFLGGALGGLFYSKWGDHGVLLFAAGNSLVWLCCGWVLPPYTLNKTISVYLTNHNGMHNHQLIDRIRAVNGVQSVILHEDESIAYLEVDSAVYDDTELQQLIKT